MIHKNYLQLIATGLAVGAFLTALAFSSNLIAMANAIPLQDKETAGNSTSLTDIDGSIINTPSPEGGTPLSDMLDLSPLSVDLSESVSEKQDSSSNSLNTPSSSSTSSKSDSPSKTSSYHTSQESSKTPSSHVSGESSSKPSPHDAVSHSTPSSKPSESASSANSSSKEPSSNSKPSSNSSSKPAESSQSISSKPNESSAESSGNSNNTGITVTVSVGGAVTEMAAYDAICQIVEGEMGSSFSPEALKAQAVAAYSYIKYENKAGRSPSLPMRTPSQKVQAAVSSVIGQAVYYNGSVAFTPYHASSAGYTNSSAEVWGGSYGYLTNVSSAYDPSAGYKNLTTTISVSTVKSGLERFFGIMLDDSNPQNWMKITSANQGGYVTKLTVMDINGQTYSTTGRKLRENILNYALKSHAFTFTYDGSNFIFSTNGYGHGVGMSQTGANGYAINEGWTYQQILTHYYPGTNVY